MQGWKIYLLPGVAALLLLLYVLLLRSDTSEPTPEPATQGRPPLPGADAPRRAPTDEADPDPAGDRPSPAGS
jgi:hypothetical protein